MTTSSRGGSRNHHDGSLPHQLAVVYLPVPAFDEAAISDNARIGDTFPNAIVAPALALVAPEAGEARGGIQLQ